MSKHICGAMTALITPFRNGSLDEAAYAGLIRRQIENGIDAVVPVGTTGESATLSHDEHKRCIEIAVDVCRGSSVKVVAGAGSNATHEAIDIARHAQECGADALLSVAPYYNKPGQEGIFRHYSAIAAAVEIPVMIYNVPGRTSVDILPSTVFRLFDEVENIYAIKEATGSMERAVDLLAARPELCLVSGDDAIDFPLLANGAKGVISVTANLLPDMKSELVQAALSGDLKRSKDINDRLYPVNKAMFIESNPVPIKAAMYIAGLIETLEYRLPLVPPGTDNMRHIENAIKDFNIPGVN